MKKLLITLIVLVIVAGAAGGAYYYKYGKAPEPEVSTVTVTRGEVAQLVAATGTVEAVHTVDVGTQVNGTVIDLFGVDFNSIVKKGQQIAKIDPKTIEATIERDKANLESAQANLERQNVSLDDSRVKLKRAEDLHNRRLLTDQDWENAQLAVKTNEASLKSQEASIKQIRAQLNQDQVNLGYTDIFAPINGIVVNRKVDVGVTVVSNNAASLLFQIAEDLTKMQLKASVDESDVGWLRPGQHATFTVDAFTGKTFSGTVSQVRLQPVVSQNVVTYTTVIDVPNPNLELRPGMTASVKIEIARKDDVLRIPAAAIRFRATRELFEALNIPVPPELQQRGRGSRGGMPQLAGGAQGQGGQNGNRANGAFASGGGDRATQPADQQAMLRRNGQGGQGQSAQGQSAQSQGGQQRGERQGQRQPGQGGDRQGMGQRQQGQGGGQFAGGAGGGRGQGGQQMTPEEREKRRQEFMARMTPEQRAQFEERMKQGGFGGGRGQGNGRQGMQGGQVPQGGQFAQSGQSGRFGGGRGRLAANETGPTTGITERAGEGGTIDALFAPLQFTESPGRVWVWTTDGKTRSLKSINIRTGINDGTNYELASGEGITEGMKLVSSIDTGQNNTQVRPNSNPLMPGQQQRGMGGFGGPGGGGGGRGGR